MTQDRRSVLLGNTKESLVACILRLERQANEAVPHSTAIWSAIRRRVADMELEISRLQRKNYWARQEIDTLRRELEKARHGCFDMLCPVCDADREVQP